MRWELSSSCWLNPHGFSSKIPQGILEGSTPSPSDVSSSFHHLSLSQCKRLVPSGLSPFGASPVLYVHCNCHNTPLTSFVINVRLCHSLAQILQRLLSHSLKAEVSQCFLVPLCYSPWCLFPVPWLSWLQPHRLPCWASNMPGTHLFQDFPLVLGCLWLLGKYFFCSHTMLSGWELATFSGPIWKREQRSPLPWSLILGVLSVPTCHPHLTLRWQGMTPLFKESSLLHSPAHEVFT